MVETDLGAELRALTPKLLSRLAGRGYLGYLHGQKERLLGSRGQKRVNRPELVEAHGYDTKYAMHAARLGYQGLELLETGGLTLPMPEPERSRVMAIRTGERTFERGDRRDRGGRAPLAEALERSPLPERPTAPRRPFLVDAYRRAWGWLAGRGADEPGGRAASGATRMWRNQADAPVSEAGGATHGGSTPSIRTHRTSDRRRHPRCARTTRSRFEPMSKRRRGFPSETRVKRGERSVGGGKELLERLGNDDLCPCGSGRRFQAVLPEQRPLSTAPDAPTTSGSAERRPPGLPSLN